MTVVILQQLRMLEGSLLRSINRLEFECLGLQVSCMIRTAATSGLVCSIFSTGKSFLHILLHFTIFEGVKLQRFTVACPYS